MLGMLLNGFCSKIPNGSSDWSIMSQRVLRVYGINALVVTQRDTNERRRHIAAIVIVRAILKNFMIPQRLSFLVTYDSFLVCYV